MIKKIVDTILNFIEEKKESLGCFFVGFSFLLLIFLSLCVTGGHPTTRDIAIMIFICITLIFAVISICMKITKNPNIDNDTKTIVLIIFVILFFVTGMALEGNSKRKVKDYDYHRLQTPLHPGYPPPAGCGGNSG